MITVLTGTNHFLIQHELKNLKNDFIKQWGESGLEIVSVDQIDTLRLRELLTGISLFAQHRCVIIKNLSQSKDLSELFLQLSKQVSEETEVILVEEKIDKRTAFYKTLKKDYKLIEFGELSESELSRWVTEEVKQAGGSISSSVVRGLIQYVGTDQDRLHNEIEKLVAYDPVITEATVVELVEKKPEDTVFQLLDASLSGRSERALDILDGLERAHEDPFATANMLIWQTHILALAYAAKNVSESEASKATKINPYVFSKTKSIANRLSQQKLEHIIDRVAQMDVKLKTTSSNPWRLLEQTILSL